MSKNICVIIGTRPEAIKMAPVIQALRNRNRFNVQLCSTGQHKELLQDALNAFDLKPNFELDVMKQGQSLSKLTASILVNLDNHFSIHRPDMVIVHGDTTSAMAGATAAFLHQIELSHVEAGLRTGNLLSPFPEEYNRKFVSIAAKLHFAPTVQAKNNLIVEGIQEDLIHITGNTVIDALLSVVKKVESSPKKIQALRKHLFPILGFNFEKEKFILITTHRRENFGKGIQNICLSIRELAKDNPSMRFVLPIHLNPKVKNIVIAQLSGQENIHLIPPQGYTEFAWLLSHCFMILTDSGGIQEEAPSLGKPVLVMRNTSERPEALQAGTAILVSTDPNKIIKTTQQIIDNRKSYSDMAKANNPYGDGNSSEKIADQLENLFC